MRKHKIKPGEEALAKAVGELHGCRTAVEDPPTGNYPTKQQPPTNAVDIAVRNLSACDLNPRKRFDEAELEELTRSIRAHGVLQPILVRPKGTGYEIIAGERRWRAAGAAGLDVIPAVIRDIDDTQALEIMVVENSQRAGLEPLEEARGFGALVNVGYDAAKIAARVGRSVAYVYDRLKLLQLTEPAQKLLEDGRIQAGHAILLARLKPEDQARALSLDKKTGDWSCERRGGGGVFDGEDLLWDPDKPSDKPKPFFAVKTKTVKELQAWIDKNVKIDVDGDESHPRLFPAAAEQLASARETAEKIIPITYDYHVVPEAKDGTRVWGPRSWKRAEKLCGHAITGVVAIGPHRGEAFKVCVAKDKCKSHWGKEQREKAKRAKGEAGASAKARQNSWQKAEEKRKAQQAAEEAERKRWEKCIPEIAGVVSSAILKAPATAGGVLGKILLGGQGYRAATNKLMALVPPGKTADSLVRRLAWEQVLTEITHSWRCKQVAKGLKAHFGIDAWKILDRVAPVSPSKPAKPEKANAKGRAKSAASRAESSEESEEFDSGVCRRCGCMDDSPCPQGCAWGDIEETICSACVDDGGNELPPIKRKASKVRVRRCARKGCGNAVTGRNRVCDVHGHGR